jgi:hypothetical protein
MGNRNPNSTNYVHADEPNILNIHKAMDYNGQGKPTLRTSVTTLASEGNPSGASAFGEPVSVPIMPVIQLDALYGFDPREFESFSQFGGTTESTGTLYKCHTNTDPFGYGVIRSKRVIRYRPGQGVLARFTAAYENPQVGVTLRAGLFAQEQALNIGYDDVTGQFGILRQNGGKAEIQELTVGATTLGGDIEIVLNDGAPVTVTLVTDDAVGTAAQIAATAFPGWTVEQCDDKVRFLSQSVGVNTGAFTFTATTATVTGSFAQAQAGVADTNNWTYQSDWNVDTLDGNGPSGVNMDWSKLNIFQVNFRWLGAGEIRWAVENPETGDMMFIHHEHYSNRNTGVHLDNPSFKIGYIAANLSANTITDSHITGASMMAAIEGHIIDNSYTTAASSGTLASLSQNNLHKVLTLRNALVYQNKINLREMKLKTLSISSQNNSPVEIFLILDGVFSDIHEYIRVGDFSSAHIDNTINGTYVAADEQPIVALINGINGTNTFDLAEYNITLPPNNDITVAVRSAGTIQEVSAALTWSET